MAYAGTAGHQKLRKLGGQSGAAASFAGEPARGALIEEAGADRTTLARFSATVEAELLVDDEVGEDDQQALVDVSDEGELKAAFSRRSREEHEALKRGRTWIGATDTLAERIVAFFTGPQPPIWTMRPPRQQVRMIEGLGASAAEETTDVVVSAEETAAAIPVVPLAVDIAPEHDDGASLLPIASFPTIKVVKTNAEIPPTIIVPSQKKGAHQQEREQRLKRSLSTLIFGNADDIQRVRPSRGKATTKREGKKKPPIQVEVKEIPAIVIEEQLLPRVPSPSKKKKKKGFDQKQTLWEFVAQEPVAEPPPVRVAVPTPVAEPQQLTLF
jgi:hypothetical protein